MQIDRQANRLRARWSNFRRAHFILPLRRSFMNWPPVVALFLPLMPASAGRHALRYRRGLAGSVASLADLPTPDAIFD
jgi:uncharacterized protein YbjT (DUF2867 family)